MSRNIGAVVLMAGLSRRMPARNKLLLKIDGRSVAVQTVNNLRRAGFSTILVVTGHEEDKIRAELKDSGVSFLHNENYLDGMGSAIAKAIQATEGWEGALIAMGDMPFVSVEILQKIRRRFLRYPESIVAPIFGQKRGQPVLFSARFFSELAACSGEIGGRRIIQKHAASVQLVPVENETIFWDIDTLEDLRYSDKDPSHG